MISRISLECLHRRFPEKPVEVLPSGIDPDPRAKIRPRGEIRRRYQISPTAFVVTCAGNLTPTKRLTRVLHAFAEIVDKVPEALHRRGDSFAGFGAKVPRTINEPPAECLVAHRSRITNP